MKEVHHPLNPTIPIINIYHEACVNMYQDIDTTAVLFAVSLKLRTTQEVLNSRIDGLWYT
jgi:hypothetical protein